MLHLVIFSYLGGLQLVLQLHARGEDDAVGCQQKKQRSVSRRASGTIKNLLL